MILDTIAESTKRRVEPAKKAVPLEEMRRNALKKPVNAFAFERALRAPGISLICEIKKASPSKGVIAKEFSYLGTAVEYEAAGANAISVLTEPHFFQGSSSYLGEIKQWVSLPLLRKDFIIDEYQLYESRFLGADAVLLICALLDERTLERFINISRLLGLASLVEAHDEGEIKAAVRAGASIIGVNNRDLKTFSVDINTCAEVRPLVPEDVLFVAESGIKTADDIRLLEKIGADGALIGEALMRSPDKKRALKALKRDV